MPRVSMTMISMTMISMILIGMTRSGRMIMAFKAAVAGGTIAFRLAATLGCAVT
jgi:hypothetical protein